MRQHGSPGRPIVFEFWAPHIQFVRNAFAVKHARKITRSLWIFVITTTSKYVNVFATANLV